MGKLANGAYKKILRYLGEAKADEVAEYVRNGEMTAEEASEWADQIEADYEHSRHRRDIEPEEWRDFEEGWRPDGW